MSILFRRLAQLLFYRPLIVVVLVLVYLVLALLLATGDPKSRGVMVAVMSAFAAAGLSGTLTERIRRHSRDAGFLGIPNHTAAMRAGQGLFLGIFVGLPACTACLLGVSPPIAIAALTIASAIGIALATYGGLWIVVVPLLTRWLPVSSWAAIPAVQALAAAASCWVIWRWFALPQRVERLGSYSQPAFADATHERAQIQVAPEPQRASEFAPPAVPFKRGRDFSLWLAAGLGYSIATVWRGVLRGAAVPLAVLVGWHLYQRQSAEPLAYILATGLCCFALVGRLQRMLKRWFLTAPEQELLYLSPCFPEPQQVKRATIYSTLIVQRGALAAWALCSTVASMLGWIDGSQLLMGAVILLTSSLTFNGALWATLAHRRIRGWHLSTIVQVITGIAGGIVVLLGNTHSMILLLYGTGMIVTPMVLGLAWYLSRPLRFPLDVDPAALRSEL